MTKLLSLIPLLLLASECLAASVDTDAPTKADVIVYGSTPDGFCAAIAAAGQTEVENK